MGTDNDQLQPPARDSVAAGYEKSDVGLKGLAIFVVCLVVFAAAVHVAIWFLYADFLKVERSKDRPMSALTDSEYITAYNRSHGTTLPVVAAPLPPPPRIQPTAGLSQQNTPRADLQQMYAQEDALFRRMGWAVDERTHVQREIPVSVIDSVIADERGRGQSRSGPAASPEKDRHQ